MAAGKRDKIAGVPWWRWAVTAALGLIVAVAAWMYFERAGTGRLPLVPGMQGLPGTEEIPRAGEAPIIRPLTDMDQDYLDHQRETYAALARRHVGAQRQGGADDLRVIQRLVDTGVVGAEQTRELQALGVAFGDVLVNELQGLEWVVVIDELGRSRALRWRETDNLLFPVTMISRRVEHDVPVDVRGLYAKMSDTVAQLRAMTGTGNG